MSKRFQLHCSVVVFIFNKAETVKSSRSLSHQPRSFPFNDTSLIKQLEIDFEKCECFLLKPVKQIWLLLHLPTTLINPSVMIHCQWTLSSISSLSLSLLNTWILQFLLNPYLRTSSFCFWTALYLCSCHVVRVADSHPALPPWHLPSSTWYGYWIFLEVKIASRLSYRHSYILSTSR